MKDNTWRGTIAHVGKITDDNRVIDALFLTLVRGPLPLIDHAEGSPGVVVGTVDAIGFNDDRAVLGSGRTVLEPGEYTIVGIDLDHLESEANEEGSLLRSTGRLIALHVNRGPRSVWSDVQITVEAPS